MADPREKRAKKFYMKIFFDDKDLYKIFLEYYDKAVEEDSAEPEAKAMIMFRDEYEEIEDGWRKI